MAIPVIGLGSAMFLAGEMPYGADYAAVLLIIAALATTLLPARRSAGTRSKTRRSGAEGQRRQSPRRRAGPWGHDLRASALGYAALCPSSTAPDL